MAASKPDMVEELLREAELVVREAPPAVRSDMAQVTSQRDGDFSLFVNPSLMRTL